MQRSRPVPWRCEILRGPQRRHLLGHRGRDELVNAGAVFAANALHSVLE